MFGLSFGELVIIFGIALLVLGPKGLPQLARTLGKAFRQFKNATGDLRETMETEFYRMDDDERPKPRGPSSPPYPPEPTISKPAGAPPGPAAAAAIPSAAPPAPAPGPDEPAPPAPAPKPPEAAS